jgi:hypothetical protein
MARSSECTEQYAQKVFDSADIVREGCYAKPRKSQYSSLRFEHEAHGNCGVRFRHCSSRLAPHQ